MRARPRVAGSAVSEARTAMSPTTPRAGRRRLSLGLLALTVAGGLASGAVTAVTTTAAVSAEPAGDCAVATPLADVHSDDPVTGLTVTRGTVPEAFTGTVLGVLRDGIAPGVDMVMVRLSSPVIDKVGIWEGMSGSPVYAADGSLIGAVAFGLAAGPSPVAGVTPYEAMDDYLVPAASRVPLGGTAARTVARAADVGLAAANRGFAALPTPVGVSGVDAARLARLDRRAAGHPWAERAARSAQPLGRADAAAPGAPDASSIVAGGNLAASLVYGDVTMAAVGTVTSVCAGHVVGFGHPLEWSGRTTLGLHPADAIYVQDDLLTGFKVANIGAPVGTIRQDRGTGITGDLGRLTPTADIVTQVTYGARSRTGASHVVRRTPDNTASTALFQVLGEHASVVDGPARGTEDVTWTVSGTGPDGAAYSVSTGDLFAARGDVSWDAGFAVGELVYRLDRLPGVSVDTVTSAHRLSDGVALDRIQAVQVKQGRTWRPLTPRTALTARAGQVLRVRVLLTTVSGASRTVPARLSVPRSYGGQMLTLAVAGGNVLASGRAPRTLAEMEAQVASRVRNDQLQVVLMREPMVSEDSGYEEMRTARGARARAPRQVSTVVGPLGAVVRGQRFGMVAVR